MKSIVVKLINNILRFYYYLMRTGSKVFKRYKVRKYYLPNAYNVAGRKVLSKNQRRELKNYWHKYTRNFDFSYHKYYTGVSGVFDVRYIPDDLYMGIIDPYLNNRELHNGVCDKNYFDILFPEANMPKTYVRLIDGVFLNEAYQIITKEDAVCILEAAKIYISKPTMGSCGGANVSLHSGEDKKVISEFLSNLPSANMIFQERIEQHEVLSSIHPESLNTMRMMTLRIGEEIHFLHTVLRTGVGNSIVDNAMSGGVFCGVNENGKLKNVGFNEHGTRYSVHPNGYNFETDITYIPGFEEAKTMVMKYASQMVHFRLIGWDIAINKDGKPVLIEANLQAGDIDVIQPVNGPLFGNLTERVLDEVFCGVKR